MEHIRGNVYVELISPGCNVSIIATEKGTLIVDTPLVLRQAAAINEAFSTAGHKPVRFISLTHRHHDHILGTNLFGDEALIIGNRITYENMGECDPAAVEAWINTWTWENPDDVREMLAAQVSPPEMVFEEELTLYLGGVEIWFFPLPGHVVEQIGAFVPQAGVLITGDALLNEHHPYMGQGNFQVWFRSFTKMKDLKAEHIIPGHGPVCGYEAVEKQQRYMERMMEIRARWDPSEDQGAVSSSAVDELLAFYPLHGRPEAMMRERIIESIGVAGDPQF
ncbi:MAG: MBL fold metallo-hydrolase [Proteobacteria bacterium]|nr:MBL fold metallo-hydrolase [Pseudomonadota bacterium]